MHRIPIPDMLFWTFVTLLLLWYISFLFKRRNLYKLASRINGPRPLPILGNFLKFLIPSEKVAEAMHEAITYYKSPTRVWFGPQLAFHIWDPMQVQIVLNSPHCLEKPNNLYKVTEPVLGKGLLNLPVNKWKQHRRVIAPILNETNVKSFFDIIQKHSMAFAENLKCKEGKGMFDIKNYLLKNSLEIALDAILRFEGSKPNCDTAKFLQWLEDIQVATVYKMSKRWFLPDFLFNLTAMGRKLRKAAEEYATYIDTVISQWEQETLAQHRDNQELVNAKESPKPVKFVEYLLSMSDEGGKLTSEELRNEVQTVIVGAFDTTALSLGFVLLALGMFSEVQEKVYKEVTEMLPPDGKFQYEDLGKLEYLDRVIKESMRIFPAGPGVARYLNKELQLGEYTIPADCIILISLFGLHRDPNIWPNPTRFDPDRFLPDEVEKRHPYSWMGFSGGPRNCVGFRFALILLKVAIIEVIRSYKIGTMYKSIEDVDLNWVFLFQPTRGYQITLNARVKEIF